MSKLIIVESPTKAKTISKFLPRTYIVKSSKGHIRDLPKKEMGIDIENNFEPAYVIPDKSIKLVADLKKIAGNADEVILATDEDREGEAIAWHLTQALKLKPKETKRIVFHEITKNAIETALKEPRFIDMDLVNSQQARRVLDRLVGYELSPFLWEKIRYGLSAGRVQSVAVRLVCEREDEIRKFKTDEYWTIETELQKKDGALPTLLCKLVKIKDKTLEKLEIKNEKEATAISDDLKKSEFVVQDIKKKQVQKKPPVPLTTSSLQQEASIRLGYSSKKTMMIAQQLYEGVKLEGGNELGLITYMRTDSLHLSGEAVSKIRDYIKDTLGAKYLPENPVFYKTNTKGAQEAHEAIRPASPEKHPDDVRQYLTEEQFKIYNLIWRRTVACQMNPMLVDATTVDIGAGDYLLRANGGIVIFDGFAKIYAVSAKETFLPELKAEEMLNLLSVKPEQHFTEPSARYSEATLIKALEENGVGRPSTYAPTITTIQERKYVTKNQDKKFAPTETGELVNKILVEHFPDIVDISFTAKMEEDLDEIATSKLEWQPMIKAFYEPFHKNLKKKKKELNKKELTEEKTDQKCDKCGHEMIIKIGRYGKFLACSNYPDCKNTKKIAKTGEDGKPEEAPEPELTGEQCEKCGHDMVLKVGRFGKFIACSNYPACKNTKPITLGIKCPKCKTGDIVEKRTRRGRLFYGCSRYPECELAIWGKPTGEICPKCQSLIVMAAKGKTKCSNQECK